MNIRLRDINVRPLSQLWLMVLLFIHTLNVDAETFQSATLKRDDDSLIHYYLSPSSDTSAADTLLLLLQGSDCRSVVQDLDGYLEYAQVWPAADVVMIEKYGLTAAQKDEKPERSEDCPTAYLLHDKPSQRQADAIQVLEELQTKYRHFIIMGGSEGAVIAARVCALYQASACILMNGGGRWFEDDVIHNIRTTETEKTEEQIAGFREFAQFIRNTPEATAIVSEHGSQWWRQSLSTDLQEVIGRVASPVFMLQSELDTQVDVAAAAIMAAQLQKSGKQLEFQVLPGLDHAFKDGEGKSRKLTVILPVRKWLNQILTR